MQAQILSEYMNRTEYKILKGFCECYIVELCFLKNGVLVIPGFVLQKINQQELNTLNKWVENKENQLIITPGLHEANLRPILETTVDISICKTEIVFEEFKVDYEIKSMAKEVLFKSEGHVLGINYRKNTGTGLITIVTLPLLDYKYSHKEGKQKELFNSLIIEKTFDIKSLDAEETKIRIDDIHLFIIVLCASGVNIEKDIASQVKTYFGRNVSLSDLEYKYKQLVTGEYISDNKLSEKGFDIVKEKKLKSFINAVKQRGEKEDGWGKE